MFPGSAGQLNLSSRDGLLQDDGCSNYFSCIPKSLQFSQIYTAMTIQGQYTLFFHPIKTLSGMIVKITRRKLPLSAQTSTFPINVFGKRGSVLLDGVNSMTTLTELKEKIKRAAENKEVCLYKEHRGRKISLDKNSRASFVFFSAFESTYIQRLDVLPRFFHLERVHPILFSEICLGKLKKLTICSIQLRTLDLRDLDRLKYLKLENVGLSALLAPDQMLEYCNISRNDIARCDVRSQVLIASGNKIKRFYSNHLYEYLDMSNNPLEVFDAPSKILYIAKTRLVHPISSPAWKIVADRTKGISFSYCPNLIHLSINSCRLYRLDHAVSGVKVIKARNNYLEELPPFYSLEYGDFSGNFIVEAHLPPTVVGLDLSKNGVSSFSLKNLERLRYVSLSFNPLECLHLPHNPDALRKIRIRTNISLMKRLNLVHTVSLEREHRCGGESKAPIRKYIVRGTAYGKPATLILIYRAEVFVQNADIEAIWRKSLQSSSALSFILVFSSLLTTLLHQHDQNATALVVMVSVKSVFIRSVGIPCLFYNFAECKRVSSRNVIRVFTNIGRWIVLPLFCKLKSGSESRFYKLPKNLGDLRDFFIFLDFFCILSLRFMIRNCVNIIEREKAGFSCALVLHTPFSDDQKFWKLFNSQSFFRWESCPKLFGSSNIDFGMGFCQHDSRRLVSTSMPVFSFLKVSYGACRHPIFKAEKYNIINILDTYCKLFSGTYVEKDFYFYIVVFKNAISASLWGIRVKSTLETLGITVGVGITGDTVFRTEIGGYLRFSGPAFNKASRIASSGTGVFCSSYLLVSHPNIECVDEGECFFKGFRDSERIMSLYLKEQETFW